MSVTPTRRSPAQTPQKLARYLPLVFEASSISSEYSSALKLGDYVKTKPKTDHPHPHTHPHSSHNPGNVSSTNWGRQPSTVGDQLHHSYGRGSTLNASALTSTNPNSSVNLDFIDISSEQALMKSFHVAPVSKEVVEDTDKKRTAAALRNASIMGVILQIHIDTQKASVAVWKRGEMMYTEERPVEFFGLTQLIKVRRGEFFKQCRRPFMQQKGLQLQLKGWNQGENEIPLSLMAYNNRIINDLLERTKATESTKSLIDDPLSGIREQLYQLTMQTGKRRKPHPSMSRSQPSSTLGPGLASPAGVASASVAQSAGGDQAGSASIDDSLRSSIAKKRLAEQAGLLTITHPSEILRQQQPVLTQLPPPKPTENFESAFSPSTLTSASGTLQTESSSAASSGYSAPMSRMGKLLSQITVSIGQSIVAGMAEQKDLLTQEIQGSTTHFLGAHSRPMARPIPPKASRHGAAGLTSVRNTARTSIRKQRFRVEKVYERGKLLVRAFEFLDGAAPPGAAQLSSQGPLLAVLEGIVIPSMEERHFHTHKSNIDALDILEKSLIQRDFLVFVRGDGSLPTDHEGCLMLSAYSMEDGKWIQGSLVEAGNARCSDLLLDQIISSGNALRNLILDSKIDALVNGDRNSSPPGVLGGSRTETSNRSLTATSFRLARLSQVVENYVPEISSPFPLEVLALLQHKAMLRKRGLWSNCNKGCEDIVKAEVGLAALKMQNLSVSSGSTERELAPSTVSDRPQASRRPTATVPVSIGRLHVSDLLGTGTGSGTKTTTFQLRGSTYGSGVFTSSSAGGPNRINTREEEDSAGGKIPLFDLFHSNHALMHVKVKCAVDLLQASTSAMMQGNLGRRQG